MRYLYITVVGLLFVLISSATSVASLFQQADIVVVGSSNLRLYGTGTLALTVDQVYKGQVLPAAQLQVGWPTPANLQAQPPSTIVLTGVWFLKSTEGAGLQAIHAQGGRMGIAGYYYPVIESPPPATGDPVQSIIAEIAAADVGMQEPHSTFLLNALGDQDSPAIRQVLTSLVGSTQPRLIYAGLQGLIARGDAAALVQLQQQQNSLPVSPSVGGIAGFEGGVAGAIAAAYRNTDAGGIASLGVLATTSSPIIGLQAAAAQALAAIHNTQTLPYLVQLMNSPNASLRQSGIIGISWFANGVGIQTIQGMPSLAHLNQATPNAFTTDDTQKYLGFDQTSADEFIAFWKSWWVSNASALGY